MANGEALIELGKIEKINGLAKIEKGIVRLRKALGLCFKQNQRNFEKEIENQIKKAQKIKWYKENEMSQIDKTSLLSSLQEKLGNKSDEHDQLINRFQEYLGQSQEKNVSSSEGKKVATEKHG